MGSAKIKLFDKVAIIGVGLIGGSLALALKKKKLANEIIGVSRHRKTLLLAKKNRVIDRGSQDLNIIRDADLVILATPVKTILKLADKVSLLIKEDCIVSDVGSTKQEIVSKLEKLFPHYIGAHPLAGSEKRGLINADSGIFKGSLCILTPTKKTAPRARKRIEELWKRFGAKVVFLSAGTHDKVLSFISHLPHIAAFSLIDIIPQKYLDFAPNSLRDATRIAASDSELWTDIFLSNRDLLQAIEMLQNNISRIKSAIKKNDRKLLNSILKTAKRKREILG